MIKECEEIIIPKYMIPEGAHLVECYETETEIIVCGEPQVPEHNCDQMGCSSINHVRYRIYK
jgi:hypothetical protein